MNATLCTRLFHMTYIARYIDWQSAVRRGEWQMYVSFIWTLYFCSYVLPMLTSYEALYAIYYMIYMLTLISQFIFQFIP